MHVLWPFREHEAKTAAALSGRVKRARQNVVDAQRQRLRRHPRSAAVPAPGEATDSLKRDSRQSRIRLDYSPMATTSATVPLLHRFLGIGLVMVAAVFVTLGYLGIAPLLPRTGVSPVIAYALSGIGVVLGAIALLLLKPRAPDRKPGQSVEQYWSTPETGARVLPVWFLLEVAGMTSAIGYLLTGEPVSLIVAALAIAAFWLCGPRVFDRA